MKYYDFDKAKKIIEENKGKLVSCSLGMHEDWFWTAETIYEDGKYRRSLLTNEEVENLYLEYIEARKNGLSLFDKKADKYDVCLIGGIRGSNWATPVLELNFTNGESKTINCFIGENDGIKPWFVQGGVLSEPVNKERQSLKVED